MSPVLPVKMGENLALPGSLTACPPKMGVFKMFLNRNLLFQGSIFQGFHVSFRGGYHGVPG